MKSKLNKPDISTVVSEYLCNSCGACYAACNQGSISYQETVGGYLFPNIDADTCTHCALCYEVCPGVHFSKYLAAQMPDDPFVGDILSCHVGRATSDEIFKNSQSGGLATALLTYLLGTRQISAAIVATMQTATPPRGQVLVATSMDELIAAQKSKYVPIPMLSAISRIKKLEGPVAFVGLSCHMHGLNNLFNLYPKLKSKISIKIGLLCDRVLTNAAVDFLGQKATHQPIKHLTFRDKQRSSYPGNPVVESETGEKIVLDASLRMAIKDFFTPARCRLCFDKLNIFADVTLGDPHGLKEIDRTHGETLIFVRTQGGKELISAAERARSITIRQADAQAAVKGQGINEKRVQWPNYMQAWSELGKSLPTYPKTVQNSTGVPGSNIQKYTDALRHSIDLDAFASRKELFGFVNKQLVIKKLRGLPLWPLRKFKNMLGKH